MKGKLFWSINKLALTELFVGLTYFRYNHNKNRSGENVNHRWTFQQFFQRCKFLVPEKKISTQWILCTLKLCQSGKVDFGILGWENSVYSNKMFDRGLWHTWLGKLTFGQGALLSTQLGDFGILGWENCV